MRTRSVEWFTDRPERRAGTMPPRTIVHNWQAWGFTNDPPNAALTGHHLDVVVELSAPQVRDGRLHFHVHPVRGRLPHGNLGSVSTFVDATSSATASTVQIVNNSGTPTTAFVYVTAPGYYPPQVEPLSWLTTQVFPGEPSSLRWDTSTQLMWGTGPVETGVVFEPQQTLSVPPSGPGQSGFADFSQANGNYNLTPDATGGRAQPGTLAVDSGPSVGVNSAGLALGISGSPALIASAFPNAITTFPASGLTYWLSTSQYVEPGQVLDPYTLQSVQLPFTPGVTSLTATLTADGTWVVQPS